ncbi:MAG: ABC transporter permease, partial [Planctomycetota bacterium]
MAAIICVFTKHFALLCQMTTRDIATRYRGSMLGLLWSFITPLMMLAVYTCVFSVVFKARWAGRDGMEAAAFGTADFALLLYC